MAVRKDFNASASVLALAQRAGEGQNFDRRFAQGQQLVQNARAQQAQQDALRLESRKLELAAEQRRLGASSSTSSTRGRSPFTRSATEANAQFKKPNALGLDSATREALEIAERSNDKDTVSRILQEALGRNQQPINRSPGAGSVSGGNGAFEIDKQGNLTGTEDNRELSQQEIQQRQGFAGPGRRDQSNPLETAKRAVLADFPNLSEQAKRSLEPLVQDPNVNVSDIAVRANAVKTQRAQQELSIGQRVSGTRSLLREQADDTDDQIFAVEDRLEELDVKVAGRDLDEVRRELQSGTRGPSFGGANVFNIGGTSPNNEAADLVEALQRLRQQKLSLRDEEESLISQQIQGFQQNQQQPASPGAGGSLESMSDDELRAIAGF
jgi:hypothetical protein